MSGWQRTPLAWKNLTSDRRKLLLISGGVSFAVVLMFMQIGFRNALFDNTIQLVKLLKADLVVVSRARYNLPSEQRFDAKYLQLIRGKEEVQDVLPIYVERSLTEIHVVGQINRAIRVVGVPMTGTVFEDSDDNRKREKLADHHSALLDRRTKKVYKFETSDLEKLQLQEVELSGKSIHMVDYVDVGTDFVHDGTIFISDQAMAAYFPLRNRLNPPLEAIDLALIQTKPGIDRRALQAKLSLMAPDEFDVLTKEELMQREITFWARSTPIGIIFTIGTIMGLVVGTIICYQILFTDITDHIAEFATLKAMGYGGGYFLSLILAESLYLTVLGFVPGLGITLVLYQLLGRNTGLIMILTPSRIGFVFMLTLCMCIVSGLLAVRKLWSADPASLFK